MKRSLSIFLLLCLFAALLSGCADSLPSLPPLPGKDQTPLSEATPEPTEEAVPEPTPDPVVVPEALEVGFTLPSVANPTEDLRWYFSPASEFDCGFCYPAYCAAWSENGTIRLSPNWFFARLFFSSVDRDSDGAPRELLDLLEPGKWGTNPNEGTAGSGWNALRAVHLKYDTWRRWVAWETPERYCLLYGVCFDGREGEVGMIFDTISESFLTGAELLASAPDRGELLRLGGGLSLSYDGAELRGEYPVYTAELRLAVSNESKEACSLSVNAYTADGQTLPLEASLGVSAGEGQLWTLSLPLAAEEGGYLFESLGFRVTAQGEDGAVLFELPVRIDLNR